MSIFLVLVWYLAGALAARTMVRRGHSATIWWAGAAIFGGLTWPMAIAIRRSLGDRIEHAHERFLTDVASPAPALLAITTDVDHADDLARGLAGFGRPSVDAVGVAPVGWETSLDWVDTGERRNGIDAMDQFGGSMAARPGAAGQRPRTVVTIGSIESVAERCRGLGLRCVALPRDALRNGLGRPRLHTVAAVASATGAAVLVVPRRRLDRPSHPRRPIGAVPTEPQPGAHREPQST